MGGTDEPLLLELGKVPRIPVDGLARAKIEGGQVTFIFYVNPIALDPNAVCEERHIELVLMMPVEAAERAIEMTKVELRRAACMNCVGRHIAAMKAH